MIDSNKEIINNLVNSGLTQNEASVYICLIELTEATAFQIAKETKVPRATVYFTLEILKGKRLVSQSKRNNISYYYAESPNRLIDSSREKLEIFKRVVPEIFLQSGVGSINPKSTIHMGINGVKNAWEDIIDTLKDNNVKQLLAISSSEVFDYYPKYFEKWLKRREQAEIYTKLIGPYSDKRKIEIGSNQYREKVLYSIIIESKTISNTLRKIFMYIWNSLQHEKEI